MPQTTATHRKLILLALLFAAIVAGFSLYAPRFAQANIATSILQFSTLLALVSLGQGLVVLSGGAGIDLSVGGTVSLSAVLAMMAVRAGAPPALLPVLAIGCGLLLGLVNGVVVTRFGILPLIATLSTYFIYAGTAMALTNGAPIPGVPAWLLPFGRGTVGGIPVHFLTVVVPMFLLAAGLLAFTAWGRWVYALGFNERSARLVGIPVDRMRLLAYALAGALAGAAALVSLAWLGSARPNIGVNLELESLAAVLLGGIAITGGVGGVLGVLLAVVMIVTLKSGLQFVNVATIWQVGVVGLLLILSLLLDLLPARTRLR
ncbi:ABC transporter permease [Lichenihabitans sp. Uapishka_5]|uniref:ABC transporter permease n=1 Tax=Lichenihabitans sp. Uapishka_5 TaxID=3037302 RepID=UPI0029E8026F|nr:ABC transporter permease [Lichenihabitans sp. Uapishka_5]MDX7951303.1 ABC transporter permease [Lichenihabitans sp. Uapishka_5]